MPNIKNNYLTKYNTNFSSFKDNLRDLTSLTINTPPTAYIIIPVYAESYHTIYKNILENLQYFPDLYAVIVLNEPEEATSCLQKINTQFLSQFQDATCDNYNISEYTLLQQQNTPNIMCLNTINKPIEKKKGVGKARKLGNDLACLITELHTSDTQNPALIQLDADCCISKLWINNTLEYYSKNTQATYISSFIHTPTSCTLTNYHTHLYEAYLQYLKLGLTYANSPYNYTALGSIITCSTINYSKVRGMVQKASFEDFYFLNKLRKISLFKEQPIPIQIEARAGQRVPFGTSPKIQNLNQNGIQPLDKYPCEPWDAFTELKKLLNTVTQKIEHSKKFTTIIESLSPTTRHKLQILKIEQLQISFDQQPNNKQFKLWHDWFDAKKTMQFIRSFNIN